MTFSYWRSCFHWLVCFSFQFPHASSLTLFIDSGFSTEWLFIKLRISRHIFSQSERTNKTHEFSRAYGRLHRFSLLSDWINAPSLTGPCKCYGFSLGWTANTSTNTTQGDSSKMFLWFDRREIVWRFKVNQWFAYNCSSLVTLPPFTTLLN